MAPSGVGSAAQLVDESTQPSKQHQVRLCISSGLDVQRSVCLGLLYVQSIASLADQA